MHTASPSWSWRSSSSLSGWASVRWVTRVLVQFAPAPTKLVFDVLLLVFGVQALAAFYLPETVEGHSGAWRSLKPSITIPAAARATMWRVMLVSGQFLRSAHVTSPGFPGCSPAARVRFIQHNRVP